MAVLYENLLYNEVELYTDLFGLYLYVAFLITSCYNISLYRLELQ